MQNAVSYVGTRNPDTRVCTIVIKNHVTGNTRELPPRLDLFNHSPSGFEWGYAGSGPAQVALAILANHLLDESNHAFAFTALGLKERPPKDDLLGVSLSEFLTIRLYQKFKFRVVAHLPEEHWELKLSEINRAIEGLAAVPG